MSSINGWSLIKKALESSEDDVFLPACPETNETTPLTRQIGYHRGKTVQSIPKFLQIEGFRYVIYEAHHWIPGDNSQKADIRLFRRIIVQERYKGS